MQKIYAIVDDATLKIWQGQREDLPGEPNPHISKLHASQLPNSTDWLVIIEPYNYHARFTLGREAGVTVLPGHHDTEPIAELHKKFAHVGAEAHHSMRQLALKLHGFHGAAFHPDT